MYNNVTVYNTQYDCLVNYDITGSTNVRNWYTAPVGYIWYDTVKEEPVVTREEFVIRKATVIKPSKNSYDYAFTEKETKTTTTERDVYYNSRNNRFLRTAPKVSTKTRTEYNVPAIIVF